MMQQPQQQQQFTAPRCHSLLVSSSQEQDRQQQDQQQQQMQRQQQKKRFLVLEDLNDIVGMMRRQEMRYYGGITIHPAAVPFRPILMQWMFSVVDNLQLAPQIVPTALYYLDRCCCSSSSMKNSGGRALAAPQYRLLGMTCLELAIKVHDTSMLPLEDLVRMDGPEGVTVQEVVQMEAQVLRHLGWNLHPPTPHCFVHQYGRLLSLLLEDNSNANAAAAAWIVDRALRLVRGAVYSDLLNPLPPSTTAHASILVAMDQVCVSLPIQQSFCAHMLQVTGLSAHSTGLVKAYQHLRLVSAESASPSPVVDSPCCFGISPTTDAVPTSLAVAQQCQYQPSPPPMSQQPHSLPNHAMVSSPPQPAAPPAVYQHNPVPLYASPPPAATQSLSRGLPMTHAPLNYSRSTPDTTLPGAKPQTQNHDYNHKYVEQPTMVYSAGENLGFEVTINPSRLEDENDLARQLQDQLVMEKATDSPAWRSLGISPRQVSGVISPERLA